ncbi:hypothetical protein WJ35_15160 [Burkholderia ubonensis]|uniref:Uncharacterized protein n=1 Tax=Burkholderia ubonensis TaxID=101571 RepID=A0A1B4LGZ4_9BURK|nr:hypothetical protein WJ35_15160 [Burkholderia ubonensis]AOK13549.1 hypothetical protein WK31_24615 [Burkholderia vietnamiensis]
MRNRTDTGTGRPGRFLLDAAVLFRIKCDGTRLVAVETVVGCDVGQYIRVGNILRFDEVSVSDYNGEPVLRVTTSGCQNHGMSSLSRIGPELAAKIQGEARSASFSLGASKGHLRIGYAVARTQQVGNIEATCRRIGQQQNGMLPDINDQVGKMLRQHFVETVMPDDAPRACDFSIEGYLHNHVLAV